MKTIHIQIQQSTESKSITRFVNALLSFPDIKTIEIKKGPIKQKYINIEIPVRSVKKAWVILEPLIRNDKDTSRTSIVVCEGKLGWDDYELIYHWDTDVIDKKWRQKV